jgi:hypothetical protein
LLVHCPRRLYHCPRHDTLACQGVQPPLVAPALVGCAVPQRALVGYVVALQWDGARTRGAKLALHRAAAVTQGTVPLRMLSSAVPVCDLWCGVVGCVRAGP